MSYPTRGFWEDRHAVSLPSACRDAGSGCCARADRELRRCPSEQRRQPRLAYSGAAPDADYARHARPIERTMTQPGATTLRSPVLRRRRPGGLFNRPGIPRRSRGRLPRCGPARTAVRRRPRRRARRLCVDLRPGAADRPHRDCRLPAVDLVAAAQPAQTALAGRSRRRADARRSSRQQRSSIGALCLGGGGSAALGGGAAQAPRRRGRKIESTEAMTSTPSRSCSAISRSPMAPRISARCVRA